MVAVLVIAVLAVSYRPLLFSAVDPEGAAARGVPVRTPAAAAARVFTSPAATIVASVLFAEVAAVGGLVLSLAPGVPVSVNVTTISFAIYLVCWAVGSRRAA